MIEKMGLFWATCDKCGKAFGTVSQREIVLFQLRINDWKVRGDRCTCPECVKGERA